MGRATLFTRMKIMTNLADYLVSSNNKRKKNNFKIWIITRRAKIYLFNT